MVYWCFWLVTGQSCLGMMPAMLCSRWSTIREFQTLVNCAVVEALVRQVPHCQLCMKCNPVRVYRCCRAGLTCFAGSFSRPVGPAIARCYGVNLRYADLPQHKQTRSYSSSKLVPGFTLNTFWFNGCSNFLHTRLSACGSFKQLVATESLTVRHQLTTAR